MSEHTEKRHGWWWKVLLGGAILWIITTVVTYTSLNTNLVPTIILLGSFLVPFTVMMYAAERVRGSLTPIRLMLAFTIGGVLGIIGATILEGFLQPSLYVYFGVGFAEELVKGALFIALGMAVVPKDGYQGALLGATVGAGFAAFESAGYAFNAVIGVLGTLDLAALIQTELVRAVLAPVGHILWTGILGAAIFAASRGSARIRLGWGVLVAFVAVVILHGLWDSMLFISAWIAIQVTGIDETIPYGFILPSAAEDAANIQGAVYWLGLTLISVIGILVLWRFVRTPRVVESPASVG